MANLSANDIAKIIYFASKGKTHSELESFTNDVVHFLAGKRMITKGAEIIKKLERIYNKEEGVLVATVTSPGPISETIKKEVIEALTKKYQAKKVALVLKEDSKLIGGIKIETNDEVIDLSISRKLQALAEHLNQ